MLSPHRVQVGCTGPDGVCRDLPHGGVDLLEEVVPVPVLPLEVGLEVLVGYFVSLFVLSVGRE